MKRAFFGALQYLAPVLLLAYTGRTYLAKGVSLLRSTPRSTKLCGLDSIDRSLLLICGYVSPWGNTLLCYYHSWMGLTICCRIHAICCLFNSWSEHSWAILLAVCNSWAPGFTRIASVLDGWTPWRSQQGLYLCASTVLQIPENVICCIDSQVKKRPRLPEQKNDGIPDQEAAITAWRMHKQLNESIIVELFQVWDDCFNFGVHHWLFSECYFHLSRTGPIQVHCDLPDLPEEICDFWRFCQSIPAHCTGLKGLHLCGCHIQVPSCPD